MCMYQKLIWMCSSLIINFINSFVSTTVTYRSEACPEANDFHTSPQACRAMWQPYAHLLGTLMKRFLKNVFKF